MESFDDMQDRKQAAFERYRAQLLAGHRFDCPHETARGEIVEDADIFDLMSNMWLVSIPSPESVAHLNQARNLQHDDGQRIADLMVEGDDAALDAIEQSKGRDLAYWVSKACEKDSDFVDEAVQLILDGEAGKYFK